MIKKVDVAIIGAGSAGMFALREISKRTNNFVIIDPGPLGTTCARIACMPSKILLQVAEDYHVRSKFLAEGIGGGENLFIDRKLALKYVRSMRDKFVEHVRKALSEFEEHIIGEHAEFESANCLKAGKYRIEAKKTIIATGSRPLMLPEWKKFGGRILTSDTFFELEDIPGKVAVLGMGAVGAELGQAMSRLGVEVTAFNQNSAIGGLTDPTVQMHALKLLSSEFPIHVGAKAEMTLKEDSLLVKSDKNSSAVDAVLASIGRRPNFDSLGLDKIGAELNSHGAPIYDPTTMQIKNLPVFIAGDADGDRAVLPEAADEGRIAGYNSVNDILAFKRRTRLAITFTSPTIAIVGASFKDLQGTDFVTGEVRFADQGRSVIMQENKGMLHVYAQRETGKLLGAEMIAPRGEHLAHLLALGIDQNLTVFDLLKMPFYHPVIEQGLRTALRDLTGKITRKMASFELALCDGSSLGFD